MLSKAFSKSIPSAKIPLGEKNRTRYNARRPFLKVMINKLSVLILIQGRKDMEIMLSLCVCAYPVYVRRHVSHAQNVLHEPHTRAVC